MDCVSLVLVEVLAALHIILSLTSLLSSSVTLIAQRWVLSAPWCAIEGFISYVCVATQLFTVFLISCYRMYALRHPLASPGRVLRRFIVILVLVTLSVMFTTIMGEYYFFSPTLLACRLSHKLGSSTALLILGAVFFLLPLILTIAFNVVVYLDSANKSGRSVRQRDNVRTMFAVSLTSALCYLPITIVSMYATLHNVPAWLELSSLQVFYINIYINPILYAAFSSGFRRFLIKGRRAEQNQGGGAGAQVVNPAAIEVKTSPRTVRVSTAEQLKPIPTASSTSPPEVEVPKGMFARAYAQAVRKSSIPTDYDENWEYYFAS